MEWKDHSEQYLTKIKERHSLGEAKRKEDLQKAREISDWLTKSVKKTKIHKLVEE